MKIQILGSAAGGGLPQWNCRCPNCELARQPGSAVAPRTQSAAAMTSDGEHWFLLNVSADVRQQLLTHRNLWPAGSGARGTPIAGCLLTDAEIDHSSGLLQLREGCRFTIHSTALVRRWLTRDLPIAPVVAQFAERDWVELPWDEPTELTLPGGEASGLDVELVDVGVDVPRYVQPADDSRGAVVGFAIRERSTGAMVVYAPGIPAVTEHLNAVASRADGVLVDGTFWSDDEPREAGIRDITAREMGHVPVNGDQGTFRWLASLPARHRVYVHMNNTNPMLNELSSQHARVTAEGVTVARDGDLFEVTGK